MWSLWSRKIRVCCVATVACSLCLFFVREESEESGSDKGGTRKRGEVTEGGEERSR